MSSMLKTAKDSGVYQAFVMDEVFQKMEGGNAAIAMYYAGDYLTMVSLHVRVCNRGASRQDLRSDL